MKSVPSIFCLIFLLVSCTQKKDHQLFDVIVLGEGTGAVSAAIQASRGKAKTLYINPLPWFGGMLTAAGVSATDGNHKLPSGLWGEWRGMLRKHYGGTDSLFTGWVSNTMFEPKVGAQYWRQLVQSESKLTVIENQTWTTIIKENNLWIITLQDGSVLHAKILIDGTDLGDVAGYLGVDYDLGMEAKSITGEPMAPEKNNQIVQDLTYVAILEDFGKASNHTIPKPEHYNPKLYHCSCQKNCDDPKAHDCETMLTYGKLPNDKYMINWPINGNDYYANVIDLLHEERAKIYEKAKQHTLGFVYYIQTELGYQNLGLADEFPSEDGLALMPYHREGRRIDGITRLTVNHILKPFDYELYRAGIAVADYPVDHHHDKNNEAPDIEFPFIPSYNIPIGCLLPKQMDGLIVADKAISVSNIANGTTRLQPVIIQIGQAAGMIAALSIELDQKPRDIPVRKIQEAMLQEDVYLMPYIDVELEDPDFKAIQKIGATGILRGKGIPFKWANQTWFYPDRLVEVSPLIDNLIDFDAAFENFHLDQQYLNGSGFDQLIKFWEQTFEINIHTDYKIQENQVLQRRTFARLLQQICDPFQGKPIDHNGQFIN